MKKIYLFVFLLTSAFIHSQSKDYNEMINAGTYTVKEIQTAAEAYFANRDKGQGSGYKQFKRWEYEALRSMTDNGVLKSAAFYYNELETYNKKMNKKGVTAKSATTSSGNWQELGPFSKNASSNGAPGTGRVMALAIDKSNVNHIIAGSETGGVWKSTNAGANWTPLTDNLANLRVNSLAIHPTNSSIYFWGTNSGTIFKSTDAGATWNILATVGTGLVNKIIIDPTTTTKLYCSVENSGVYKSTDSGITWTAISSELNSGYDVEFKPSNSNIVYASGNKFLRSTDGGATFSLNSPGIANWQFEYTPAAVSGSNIPWQTSTSNKTAFGITEVHPQTGDALGRFDTGTDNIKGNKTKLVSIPVNISIGTNPVLKFAHAQPEFFGDVDKLKVYYKTSAAGSWIELASYTADIQAWVNKTLPLPNPSSTYYIAFEAETNGGGSVVLDDVSVETSNGVLLTEGFEGGSSNTFGTGAKMIAVSANNPDVVYLAETNTPSTQGAYFSALYKSTDSGVNLIKIPQTKNFFGGSLDGSDIGGQAPFHMDIAASQTDANTVFLGGLNTWRSTDGGTNFNLASHLRVSTAASENVGYTHGDICIIEAVGSKVYVGSDGGFFVANNPSATMNTSFYTDLSNGLGIKQFYKFGISQTNPVVITGGAQDNGSSGRTAAGVWYDWNDADGGEGFVDKNNSNILYGSSQNGSFRRTTDVTNASSLDFVYSPSDGAGNFITPLEQDPITQGVFYSGFKHVYKSTNATGNPWTAISQDFGADLFQLKIAQSNNLIMYTSGSNTFGLYKTTDGGATNWTKVTSYPGGFITSIAIHPTKPNYVAVTTEEAGKVYISKDGGATWTMSKFDLPNFSALAVVWDNNANDGLYVGMDYGIYYLDNTTSNSWKPFNNLLPNVKISELEINYADNKLYAATYGRGIWSTPRYNISTLKTESPAVELVGVTLYPNPVSTEVNLSWDKDEAVSVKIFNEEGKLMHYSKEVNLINNYKIDIANYTKGIYFVRVNNQNGIKTKKLIVK